MRVRYTPKAFADRERIFSFLELRSPEAARNVVGLIKQRILQLGDDPYKGHRTDKLGILTLWVAPYPYRIFYRIDANEIIILHIRHTSMQVWKGQ